MKAWIVLIAALSLAAGACSGGDEPAGSEGKGGGEGTTAAAETVTARLAPVEKTLEAETVDLPGTVEADRSASVSSRVMATVTAVHVRAGDSVRRGQVLVEIDPQTAAGQVSQARGGLAQAEAGLALAERNHERFETLAKSGAASQLELDLARSQRDQARGAVEQARGAVSSASSVAAESRVTAPFDGRVTARLVEAGDLAAPGRPLIQIESGSAHRLAVSVPESLLPASGLTLGAAAEVSIDARPDLGRFAGTVAERSPGADPLAHAFLLKIALGAVDVPSGSSGRVHLKTGQRPTIAVPAEAVLRQGGMTLVVLRDADGAAVSRIVTLGSTLAGGRVEVLSGLAGGETVLLGLPAVPPLGARVVEAAR